LFKVVIQTYYICVQECQGRIQTMWKLWFHKVNLSNLHKIEKCGKEIGEKSGLSHW